MTITRAHVLAICLTLGGCLALTGTATAQGEGKTGKTETEKTETTERAQKGEEQVIPRQEELPQDPEYRDQIGRLFRKIWDKTRLGGYFDLEYHDRDTGDTFRQHRLILLMEAEIDERTRFATEIELEDGNEVEVEFATLDYKLSEELGFRAGIILDPLGRLNLYHDSPYQELTDRPLMHRTVIPTTLREPGAGIFGTFRSSEEHDFRVNYEAYGTIGFKGLDAAGTSFFDTSNGLRNGAPYKDAGGAGENKDNNDNVALVGRLSVENSFRCCNQPSVYEFGASFHTGDYDENEDNRLTIYAVDGRVVIGNLELLGEYAYADIERDSFARTSGVPNDMRGWYVQADYKLFPDVLTQWEDKGYLGEGSHMTLVFRYGETNLGGFERTRTTVGFNFRPNRSMTVLKLEYQWNEEPGSTPNVDDSGFVASVASYF
ncbi:MAG: hypothetical protein ACYTGW_13755 [Planctomycetota bacterium]